MLERLELTNLGPAQHLELALTPRFNLITGDKGLGKTFLLDLLWWSLTGNWAGLPAWTGGRPGPGLALKVLPRAGEGPPTLEAPSDHAARGKQRHGELAFGTALDQISVLNQAQDGVTLQPFAWRSRGDVSAWLTSEAFGLLEARSLEAEKAIEEARTAMLEENPDQSRLRTIHNELRGVLGDTDPFWPR